MARAVKQPRNFGFDADETALRDVAEKFFHDNLPTDTLHRLVAGDSDWKNGTASHWDKSLWQQIVDLGWLAVVVPEDAGGLGMSMVAATTLVEQAGRAALPGPLLPTLSTACILTACTTDNARDALSQIAEGRSFSYAACNSHGSWEPGDTDVELHDKVLQGTASYVQDPQKVDRFLVNAKQNGQTVLVSVAADQQGVQILPDNIVDLTRDQGRVAFDDVRIEDGDLVAGPDAALGAIEAATPALLVLVSADICGAAEWQLQTTAEYARTRRQFDHNIGFFQAVKHPLVEFMVALDLARSHLYNAACAIDHEPESAAVYARMAKSAANDAAAFGSRKSIQLHGGIGFTWECFVHIYVKRQLHNQMLLGDASWQRAKLAELLKGVA